MEALTTFTCIIYASLLLDEKFEKIRYHIFIFRKILTNLIFEKNVMKVKFIMAT